MPVGDDGAAREDAHDQVKVAPDPAMVLLGRAMLVVADVLATGLPADGRMPGSVDVTVAALDEWIRTLAQTGAFLAQECGATPEALHTAGERLIEKYGAA